MHVHTLVFCALLFPLLLPSATSANPRAKRLLCAQACQHTAACSGKTSSNRACVQRCIQDTAQTSLAHVKAFHTCVQGATCPNAQRAQDICRGFITSYDKAQQSARYLTLTDNTKDREGARIDAVLLLKEDGRLFPASSLHNHSARSNHARRLRPATPKTRYAPIFHPRSPTCSPPEHTTHRDPLCKEPVPLLALPTPAQASNLHMLLGYPDASCTKLSFGLLGGSQSKHPIVVSFEDGDTPIDIDPGDTILVQLWDHTSCLGQGAQPTDITLSLTHNPKDIRAARNLGHITDTQRSLHVR